MSSPSCRTPFLLRNSEGKFSPLTKPGTSEKDFIIFMAIALLCSFSTLVCPNFHSIKLNRGSHIMVATSFTRGRDH